MTEQLFGCFAYFFKLPRGKFNCPLDAIKNLPQDLFAECPDTLPCMQLLETDRFIIGVILGVWGWWENGVNAM